MENEVCSIENIINHSEELNQKNSVNIIVNADDLGICPERDEAIFELFSNGVISSSTILVNGVNFENSIQKAKQIGMPLGLHLNLTEGTPINKQEIENNSLVGFEEKTNNYVMHGKFGFRDKLLKGEILLSDVKYEIISQILKFREFYDDLPSHIDGHQHIHVIPEIAKILAEIMSNFGIYKIRLPIENILWLEKLNNSEKLLFYKKIIEQSKESKKIFDGHNISYPDIFIGMSMMGKNLREDDFKYKLKEICIERHAMNSYEEIFVEYMCHPGYIPRNFFWDDFNCSEDRIYEKQTIQKIFSDSKSFDRLSLKLKSFNDLPSKMGDKYNILIIGNLTYGTGNYITAMRLQRIFKILNYNCYMFNIKKIHTAIDIKLQEFELNKLKSFIIKNKIHLIYGIHIVRSGTVLNLLKKSNNFLLKIPYCLITAGTDANEFVYRETCQDLMKTAILNSEKIISFNEEMLNKLENKLGEINNKIIISQSMLISSNSSFSIRKKLKFPENYKLTLFPAGIRKIKDIKFILNELLDLLEDYEDHVVVLMGAILEVEYYNEIEVIIKSRNNPRFFIEKIVDHQDFLNVLKESNLVLNSSISEGMSNALLESMTIGVPVLARGNEGNKKLIENNKNGLLFTSGEEFKTLYKKIYADSSLREALIQNATRTVHSYFDYNSEIEKYKNITKEIFEKNFRTYENFKLYFSEKVHPFSVENNMLFESIQHKGKTDDINILDIGCGSGIFTFIFLLKNKGITVNELVLADIEDNCLYSSYQNFLYYKEIFQIKKLTLIKSDLFEKIDQRYHNYFDVVLANMPQTPSLNKIRIDKNGGSEGIALYSRLFKDAVLFIANDAKIYFLHISLSYPKFLGDFLDKLNYKIEIVYEQNRELDPTFLDSLAVGTKDYILNLHRENKSLFDIVSTTSWKYKVWMKLAEVKSKK